MNLNAHIARAHHDEILSSSTRRGPAPVRSLGEWVRDFRPLPARDYEGLRGALAAALRVTGTSPHAVAPRRNVDVEEPLRYGIHRTSSGEQGIVTGLLAREAVRYLSGRVRGWSMNLLRYAFDCDEIEVAAVDRHLRIDMRKWQSRPGVRPEDAIDAARQVASFRLDAIEAWCADIVRAYLRDEEAELWCHPDGPSARRALVAQLEEMSR